MLQPHGSDLPRGNAPAIASQIHSAVGRLSQDPPATLSRSDCGLGDPTTLHLALAPLPIKGIDSSADFSLDSFLFQILALIAMGLSTPDTEFQLHSMIFPIKAEGD